MSLDKAIEYGKERRRQYNGSKRYDRSCSHDENCDYRRNGRQHNSKKRELSGTEKLMEYKFGT